jgi:desampylase
MQADQLLAWAEQAGMDECCGLLLGRGDVVERVELTINVAGDPADSFEIDPAALIAAEKSSRQGGPAMLGYFHSHPNGAPQPSARDAQSAVADGRRWVVIADGRLTSWYPVAGGENGSVRFEPDGLDEG